VSLTLRALPFGGRQPESRDEPPELSAWFRLVPVTLTGGITRNTPKGEVMVMGTKRYLALLYPRERMGYALDYYPKERAAYARENRKAIIGDFASPDEAHAAISLRRERIAAAVEVYRRHMWQRQFGSEPMSAYCLVSGLLHREPVLRTGKESGKVFCTALLRCETGDATLWCNVVAFDERAQAELMRLHAGEALTVQGTMKVSVFEKNGEHRASLDIVASQVTPLRRAPGAARVAEDGQSGREGAMVASPRPSAPATAAVARESAFDDGVPGW
jgi:single-stranded DNA-binding protein